MKKLFTVGCRLPAVAVLLLFASAAPSAVAQERVLFVGNSLTYYNDMPTLFEGIANDKGHNVSVEAYTVGGTGLAQMLESGEVLTLIQSERWDKMVLQPGTGESVGASITLDSVAWVVRRLVAALQEANPDALVCLYEISNGVTPGTGDGDYDYYLSTQQRILDSVLRLARLAGQRIAPVGECFRAHYASHHDLMLHNTLGDIHPCLAGSYLAACAIFETLYEEYVAPCGYHAGLDHDQAEYLQHIADSIVLPNRDTWLFPQTDNPDDPDDPENPDDPDNPENPEDPDNPDNPDTPDDPLSIHPADSEPFSLYPNPTTGLLHIEAAGEVTIYDLKGTRTHLQANDGMLDLTSFAPGVYILQSGCERKKVIIARP